MSLTKIAPNFNRLDRTLTFPVDQINYLMEEQVYDHFDFYQNRFGLYSFMRLTKALKHKVHNLTALPFAWQPHKSCTIDPLGVLRSDVREVSPVKAVALSNMCYDELFDSCFEIGLSWDGQGPLQLDELGNRLYSQALVKIIESMVVGARVALTAGELYPGDSLSFADGVTEDIKNLIYKTKDTVQGWVKMTKLLGAKPGSAQMDIAGLFTADDFNGKEYVGSGANILESILALFDKMRENATHDLNSLMDQGGVGSLNGVSGMPVAPMSTYIYKAVAKAWRYQQGQAMISRNTRLTREEETFMGRTYHVYYIDGIPVIPIHDLNAYDKYLSTTTHLAAITVGGNINLGASFTEIPSIDSPGMAVRIKMSDDNEDYGNYSYRGDSLFSTLIANTDYYAGGVVTMTPE